MGCTFRQNSFKAILFLVIQILYFGLLTPAEGAVSLSTGSTSNQDTLIPQLNKSESVAFEYLKSILDQKMSQAEVERLWDEFCVKSSNDSSEPESEFCANVRKELDKAINEVCTANRIYIEDCFHQLDDGTLILTNGSRCRVHCADLAGVVADKEAQADAALQVYNECRVKKVTNPSLNCESVREIWARVRLELEKAREKLSKCINDCRERAPDGWKDKEKRCERLRMDVLRKQEALVHVCSQGFPEPRPAAACPACLEFGKIRRGGLEAICGE